jgi:chromosome segregation ATPase
VLGCQGDDRIFLLRVDRPDLTQIMPVTAAHEVLHAAYARLDPAERRRIDRLIDEAFTSSNDQRLRDLVTEYDRLEPGERHNELHSLLGTEVSALSGPLERYYRRYFRDRRRIVEAFNGYQSVFDTLKAQYDQLKSEVDALDAQLQGLSSQLKAAVGEADQLLGQIEALRAQGRIEESNRLVDAQNAAVNYANALADQHNGLVDQYNAKIDALNALAIAGQQLDDAISVEVSPG